MKAIVCQAFGPIETLRFETAPRPVCGPRDVSIRVQAAGVNFPDGLIVQGKYQTKPDRPFSPGSEIAGIVTAVGAEVKSFAVGEAVVAFCGIGGYAEQAVAPETQVFARPAAIDPTVAAGFLITYGTSYHALKDQARLAEGETLLVLGAAGGVGLAAVELGKLMGARVIAAASSPRKLALCREHGADDVIDYSTDNLRDRVRDLTDGRGADVVFDPVGGDRTQAAIRALAWGGRLLIVGFASGDIPQIPANQLLLKSASATGVLWGASLKASPALHARNITELLAWLETGKLRPHVSRILPLGEAPTALDAILAGQVEGKIVLITDTAEPWRHP